MASDYEWHGHLNGYRFDSVKMTIDKFATIILSSTYQIGQKMNAELREGLTGHWTLSHRISIILIIPIFQWFAHRKTFMIYTIKWITIFHGPRISCLQISFFQKLHCCMSKKRFEHNWKITNNKTIRAELVKYTQKRHWSHFKCTIDSLFANLSIFYQQQIIYLS